MSGAGLPIGRVGGTPVRLSWTWALVAAFIVLTFAPAVGRALPWLGAGAYAVAFAYAVLLALSVLVHEIAHALTGRAFGRQAEEIVLTLWGGHTQFGAAHASPLASVTTALAGPAANLALAGLAWAVAQAVPAASVPGLLLDVTVWANLLLAAFNVLPGLPLDGGRIVESAVWGATGSRDRGTVAAGWTGRVIALSVAAAVLVPPLLRGRAPDLAAGLLVVWVAVILWRGASAAIGHGRWGRRLAGVDLASAEVAAVPVPLHLSVAEALARTGEGRRAVVGVDEHGVARGVLDLRALSGRTPHELAATPVSAACEALAPHAILSRAELPARGADLVSRLAEADAPVWVLTDPHGAVTGVIPREALLAAVHARRPGH